MTFAVPYIGVVPGWGTAVDFFRQQVTRGSAVTLVTREPGSHGGTLPSASALLIERLGVDLRIRPNLHAKVYQFTFREGDRRAFVGSANLSRGGFQINAETVAQFREEAENDAVEEELERLTGRGAFQYSQWLAHSTKGV